MNYPENIFSLVRTLKDEFLNNYIEIVPGYTFNQYETVKKIHKYFNSQFDGSQHETINGVKRKKTFFNINKWRCMVATKMIDTDVKDFLIVANKPAVEEKVSLFRRVVVQWLQKNKLGKVLNKISRNLPIYGSVVLEKTKTGAKVLDLRYLFNDQSVEKLEDGWVIIKDLMSPTDLRKMVGVWENVDEVIHKHCYSQSKSYENSEDLNKATAQPYAEIYRFHGEVPRSWFTERKSDDDVWVKARWFVAGVDSFTKGEDNRKIYGEGITLFKEEIKEYPFKEVHYDKTEGRWMGIGIVEDTFEAQRRTNEIKNQEAKAVELGSMIVFQSQSKTAAANVLSDIENGDIIPSNTPITRIDNVNRAAPDFNNTAASYDQLADRATFSYDVVRGEAAPASSTLGAVQLQASQASSVYDFHREDIGLFLNEYFKELVFPQVEKDLQKDTEFSYSGSVEEVARIREDIAENLVMKEFEKTGNQALLDNFEEEKEKLKTEMLKKWGNKIWIKATKDYFKDISKNVDLEITGEGKNISAQLQNVQFFLSTIGSNPAMLQNPVLKGLMFKIMGLIGMDTTEIELLQKEVEESQAQAPVNVPEGTQELPNEVIQQNA